MQLWQRFQPPAFAGDPVPGVDVALEQIPEHIIYRATVDEDGVMQFGDLPVGTYRVYQEATDAETPVDATATAVDRREANRAARREARRANRQAANTAQRSVAGISAAQQTNSLQVSGPANFTPSDGDDIGMLTVTGTGPIVIEHMIARRPTNEELDRTGVAGAEDVNSTRSNTSSIIAPGSTVGVGQVLDLETLQRMGVEGLEVEAATEAEAATEGEPGD